METNQDKNNGIDRDFERLIKEFRRENADILAEAKRRICFNKNRKSKKRNAINPVLAEVSAFMRERGISLFRKKSKTPGGGVKTGPKLRILPEESAKTPSYEIPLSDNELDFLKGTRSHIQNSAPKVPQDVLPRPAAKEYVSVSLIPRLVFRTGDTEEIHSVKFVLIKDTNREFIKFPGGRIENSENETPEEAVVRETKEEVFLNVSGRANLIGELQVSPGKYVAIFTADLDGSEAQEVEPGPEQDAVYVWYAREIDARFASLGKNAQAMWRFYKTQFPEKL